MSVKAVRIPITNELMMGDYTGKIFVGAAKKPLNVILDSGSSSLALAMHKYSPDPAHGDKLTDVAQEVQYGSGSWAGAVIQTAVARGEGADQLSLPGTNVAIAYHESKDMFGKADGILGLAYAALDTAFQMPAPTWPKKYSLKQIQGGKPCEIVPYLTQLAGTGLVSDKFAFYTLRSYIHVGGPSSDAPAACDVPPEVS